MNLQSCEKGIAVSYSSQCLVRKLQTKPLHCIAQRNDLNTFEMHERTYYTYVILWCGCTHISPRRYVPTEGRENGRTMYVNIWYGRQSQVYLAGLGKWVSGTLVCQAHCSGFDPCKQLLPRAVLGDGGSAMSAMCRGFGTR